MEGLRFLYNHLCNGEQESRLFKVYENDSIVHMYCYAEKVQRDIFFPQTIKNPYHEPNEQNHILIKYN